MKRFAKTSNLFANASTRDGARTHHQYPIHLHVCALRTMMCTRKGKQCSSSTPTPISPDHHTQHTPISPNHHTQHVHGGKK